MSIKEIEGNIWNTKCQVIVNTVNCEGIMGAGMALEARLRYPEMYKKYKEICQNKQLDIGKLWIYKSTEHNHWIMNFPTKTYWRLPSKEEYIHAGLKKFLATYKEKSITSIAFPILGGMNGGLDANKVRSIMKEYLTTAENLVVEIYEYNPNISDNFFQDFKNRLRSEERR